MCIYLLTHTFLIDKREEEQFGICSVCAKNNIDKFRIIEMLIK